MQHWINILIMLFVLETTTVMKTGLLHWDTMQACVWLLQIFSFVMYWTPLQLSLDKAIIL